MTLNIYRNLELAITPQNIANFNDNYVFVEENFLYNGTLLTGSANSGGGTSNYALLTSALGQELLSALNLVLSNNTNNTIAVRTSQGRYLVLGRWKTTIIFKLLIPSVTPTINDTNNTYFYAGLCGSASIPAPNTTVDIGSIVFLYDNNGVGIRVSNATSTSIFRPPSPVFLAKNTFHTIMLRISKLTRTAQVVINGSVVMTASTTNFPAYNDTLRAMQMIVQSGRALSDTTNPAISFAVDYFSALFEKNESAGEFS